jgi:glycosyltransferase involved in cell wall biosynthesis
MNTVPANPTTPAEGAEEATPQGGRLRWFRRVGGRLRRIGRRRRRTPEVPNPSSGLRILIVSDAWKPQVNGVVRTLDTLGQYLEKFGNTVYYITPDLFRTFPLPTYSEIRLAVAPYRMIARIINVYQPDAIHIATEGPLGHAARKFCVRHEHPYTTSFHTRFPEYVNARTKLPISWGYAILRRFHNPASAVMVATPTLQKELEEKGFHNLRIWSRGVDLALFRPDALGDAPPPLDVKGPMWLYVGRVAVEKNIQAFLDLDLDGTKVVVGSGPMLEELRAKYRNVVFTGPKFGEELARIYAQADVFVFPSKTDTFGLVVVEALAAGTPVAAYPVQGPADILEGTTVGAVDDDLEAACRKALNCASPEECRAHAEKFSWEACTRQFLSNLDLPGFDESYWLEVARLPD